MALLDHHLMRRIAGGSQEAAGILFDRYWVTAWRAAFAITGSREAADDVAQDAFQRVISKARHFDSTRPFEPWLRRVVVNTALDRHRREARWAELPSSETADDHAGSTGEVNDRLSVALSRLPYDQRLAVVLRFALGYQHDEIAEMLDVPVGTVASRLGRATKRLRTQMEMSNESRA
jgi:RNA polymerase sigma-70 factor, ECF subfamily